MATTATEISRGQAGSSSRREALALLVGVAGVVLLVASMGWWSERGTRTRVSGPPGDQQGTEFAVLAPQWVGVLAGALIVAGALIWYLKLRRVSLRNRAMAGVGIFGGLVGSTWLSTLISLGQAGSWSDGRPVRGRRRRQVDLPPLVGTKHVCTAARAWLEAARHEQSSAHTFDQLAAELVEMGAPDRLVQQCREAKADEARHRHMSVAIARLHGGRWIQGPINHWAPSARRNRPTYARLAYEAFTDGLVGENFAVERLRLGAVHVGDRQCQLMEQLQREEADHVRLARNTIAWCLVRDSRRVRRVLAMAASRLSKEPDYPEELTALSDDELRQAGLVTRAEARQAWLVAIERARTDLELLLAGESLALAA